MSKYSKRTKSTKSKTYNDYKAMRAELESKGYQLKEEMNKEEFDNYYERLKLAKKNGEIKSQPWQELKKKEKLVTRAQARALSKAAEDMQLEEDLKLDPTAKKKKVTQQDIYKMGIEDITNIGQYLNEHKESGLYGGKYE